MRMPDPESIEPTWGCGPFPPEDIRVNTNSFGWCIPPRSPTVALFRTENTVAFFSSKRSNSLARAELIFPTETLCRRLGVLGDFCKHVQIRREKRSGPKRIIITCDERLLLLLVLLASGDRVYEEPTFVSP